MILTPKNWGSFQHYKDREPSWIKLHKSLLTNYEFVCLPVASKALAPMLWLLASEYKDGIIDASLDKIAFRLSMTRGDLANALTPLIESGFFDASEPLADCKQVAIPEKEKEDIEKKEEEEKETRARRAVAVAPSEFELFWNAWPNKVGKPAAQRAWISATGKRGAWFDDIMEGLQAYIRAKPPDRPWLNPATFLNQERWKDRPAPIAKPLTEHQSRRRETQEILDALNQFAGNGGEGGEADTGILPGNSGQRPESLRGGVSGNIIEISAIRDGSGGEFGRVAELGCLPKPGKVS